MIPKNGDSQLIQDIKAISLFIADTLKNYPADIAFVLIVVPLDEQTPIQSASNLTKEGMAELLGYYLKTIHKEPSLSEEYYAIGKESKDESH